jgi:hypothetical protein
MCAKLWFAKEVWISGGMVEESGRGLLGYVDELWDLWAEVVPALVDDYTRAIRSAKLGQCQPCQIYEV